MYGLLFFSSGTQWNAPCMSTELYTLEPDKRFKQSVQSGMGYESFTVTLLSCRQSTHQL